MRRWAALLALLLSTAGTASAAPPIPFGCVMFEVSAARELPTDSLRVVLYAQREGTDPRALARQVNRAVAAAIEQAQQIPSVEARTLIYRTWPVYDKGRITAWRVRQSMAIRSHNGTVLAPLLSRLQSTLAIASVDYRLSPLALERAERELTVLALNRFTARAALVARTLGRQSYHIVRLDIRTAPGGPRRAFAASLARATPGPALTPGRRRVRVTVAGTIALGPRAERKPGR